MKYMGSKRVMLQNGFGSAITAGAAKSDRIVDLMAGSGAVAWYAAQNFDQPVLAVDLQAYSAVLSAAVISRTRQLNPSKLSSGWLTPAREAAASDSRWPLGAKFGEPRNRKAVEGARTLCAETDGGLGLALLRRSLLLTTPGHADRFRTRISAEPRA